MTKKKIASQPRSSSAATAPEPEFFVEIVRDETGCVVRRMGPFGDRQAAKNTERVSSVSLGYSTRVIPAEDAADEKDPAGEKAGSAIRMIRSNYARAVADVIVRAEAAPDSAHTPGNIGRSAACLDAAREKAWTLRQTLEVLDAYPGEPS